jgi:membrane-bound serine protease (ClpP class)
VSHPLRRGGGIAGTFGAVLATAILGALWLAPIWTPPTWSAPTPSTATPAAPSEIYRITVDGVIAPATARFILRAVREAEEAAAEAVLVQLDTPGGLLTSMDEITKAILNSKIPVIVYVSPRGARAASAGVYITYAAHVAAMAPATHIGAATPVSLGGPEGEKPDRAMMDKLTNDAVANIRAIAERRRRNADWAERAVRAAASITETEAVRERVVDLVADDVDDLLRKVDGRVVETDRGRRPLRTARARVTTIPMDLTERFLAVLSDPNIGFILMNLGILGLLVEIYNPGAILPGVVGAIALVLGLASFAIVKVNVAGLLLIGLAVLMFIADIKVPGHGVLTVGGVLSFVFGAILLTQRQIPVLQISLRLILGVAAVIAAFFVLAVGATVRAQRLPPRGAGQDVVGAIGVARSDLAPDGQVHVLGELWTATAEGGPIATGQRVRVVGIDGLRLRVIASGPPAAS